MNTPYETPQIMGFDVPALTSWPIGLPQQIFALLNTSPPAEWKAAFEEEVKVSVALIREAKPELQERQIALWATPSNVGSTRMALANLLRSVENRYRRQAGVGHGRSDFK